MCGNLYFCSLTMNIYDYDDTDSGPTCRKFQGMAATLTPGKQTGSGVPVFDGELQPNMNFSAPRSTHTLFVNIFSSWLLTLVTIFRRLLIFCGVRDPAFYNYSRVLWP